MIKRFLGDTDIVGRMDWGATPVGPEADWPETLKTLVQLLMASTQPMFLCWGPERTLIYNDGYARILAEKHPEAMGRDILEVWSDISGDLEPMVAEAYRGRPVQMRDVAFYNIESGRPEESYFSFSYTPIRDGDGEVRGFFCPCEETTEQVLERRRMTLRAELSERLRYTDEPEDLRAEFLALLGDYLGADRAGLADSDMREGDFTVGAEWQKGGSGQSDRARLLRFGPSVFSVLKQGGVVWTGDTSQNPLTSDNASFAEDLGAVSMILVPLFRKGELAQVLFVFSGMRKNWLHADIELVRQKAERLWDVLERIRADWALRDENAFLDLVIEMAPVGISIARDPMGLPPILNKEGRRQTGVGQLVTGSGLYDGLGALHADGRPYDVDDYPTMRVLKTGETVENEPMIYRLDGNQRRWVVNSRPVRDVHGRIIAAVTIFNDIEDRLRAEEQVRLINRELNHRVKNLFAIIRSLTLLSGRNETDVTEFTRKLLGRIDALAASHVLSINAPDGSHADLTQITQAIMAPFTEDPHLDGPHVAVPDGSITPLGLILHELATNAAKYGAWSREGGTLNVSWIVENDGESDILVLRWNESWEAEGTVGGVGGTGFGSKLINSSAKQLGAGVDRSLREDGFLFTMRWPLPRNEDRASQLANPDPPPPSGHPSLRK